MGKLLPSGRKLFFPRAVPFNFVLPPRVTGVTPFVSPVPNPRLSALCDHRVTASLARARKIGLSLSALFIDESKFHSSPVRVRFAPNVAEIRSTVGTKFKSTESRLSKTGHGSNRRDSMENPRIGRTITSNISQRIPMATAGLEGVGCPSKLRSYRWGRGRSRSYESTGVSGLGTSAGKDCRSCLRRGALVVYRKSTDDWRLASREVSAAFLPQG